MFALHDLDHVVVHRADDLHAPALLEDRQLLGEVDLLFDRALLS